ncbi:hypothetical protein AB0395_42455 [Streptosporangium sp. NPDC051023]|uniref:hypothetical protein n=1 Tax=Streptosporangium sp. NPDC051023 TaxID=3155410 RepID=UPI00344B6646
MTGPFRPLTGKYARSVVLAELARLWEQAAHRAAADGRTITQKQLAKAAQVPETTMSSWATGAALPRDLDQLVAVGEVLAGWAGEKPSTGVVWDQRLRTDRDAQRTLAPAASADAEPGRPLEQVADPFLLEVHRPIEVDVPGTETLPVLPPYVPRAHDEHLARVVARAAGGVSAMAVLVGTSSTGKTRACWEALAALREQGEWRLWHPFDPTRPEAALADLKRVGPRTVVWLNELQLYLLDVPGDLGERVAAALRTLLADPGRAPVLVLGTLWPQYWDDLTRTAGAPDRHAQARLLLTGGDIPVESGFIGASQEALRQAAAVDPRLGKALANASDGEVTQYLAGVAELLARYRNAPPVARAVIEVAMDARRLGHRLGLPHALLETAAPGYLSDTEWNLAGEDWLEQALAYTAAPCKGVLGPVTRLRPRRGRPHTGLGAPPAASRGDAAAGGPLYRLADYLDQHGRRHRHDSLPPGEFWDAVATYAHSGDLTTLGNAAEERSLLLEAARLYKRAVPNDGYAALRLVGILRNVHPADHRPAAWTVARTCLNAPASVAMLVGALRRAGADEQVTALAQRAAAHVFLNDPYAVAELLDALRQAGAHDQVAVLLARSPATHASLNDPLSVAILLDALRQAGAHDQVAVLLARSPATHASLDNPYAVAELLGALRRTKADEQATMLLARSPATRVSLNDPDSVAELLEALDRNGADEQVIVLSQRAVAHVPLDNAFFITELLGVLREMKVDDQVAVLLARSPAAHASLNDPNSVAELLDALREMEADDQVAVLLARSPAAHASLNDPNSVAELLASSFRGEFRRT